MIVKFVYYNRAYTNFRPEIDLEMQRVLSSGNLILREDVDKFEENLARFVGTKYAIALNSGTDALYLALKSLNLKGKRVAVPSYTFKATCGAVVSSGAIPVVYDLNEFGDWTERILVVDAYIPVHIAGEITSIPKVNVPVIEDAAQALGAVKNPTTNAQCWSFYPAKILGAFGDAGAVTTNDEKIAEYIREARNHFKSDNRDFGMNSRMDNLQAAILNVKFKYLNFFIEKRERIAKKYLKELSGITRLVLPNDTKGRVYQDFIIRTEKRDELYDFLKKEGVETMKNLYPWTPDYPKLPLTAKYEAETLRLPCNPELLEEEIGYVIEKIKEFYVQNL